MFGRKKTKTTNLRIWDREQEIPAVRCSICTGEKVFGFRSVHADSFSEIAMVRDDAELAEIAAEYGITDISSIQRFY